MKNVYSTDVSGTNNYSELKEIDHLQWLNCEIVVILIISLNIEVLFESFKFIMSLPCHVISLTDAKRCMCFTSNVERTLNLVHEGCKMCRIYQQTVCR